MALADTVQVASILLLESDATISPEQARATSCASFTVDQFAQAMADAAKLESLTGRLKAIAVRQCNGYQTWDHKWDQPAADRDERLEAKLTATVESILAPYGVKAKIGGDPRGAVVYLMTPKTERHNSWGGRESGWGL